MYESLFPPRIKKLKKVIVTFHLTNLNRVRITRFNSQFALYNSQFQVYISQIREIKSELQDIFTNEKGNRNFLSLNSDIFTCMSLFFKIQTLLQ